MSARPTCDCGSCPKCKARASVARSRAKRKRGRGAHPRPWLPEPAAKPRTLGVRVELDALLSEWRAANPGSIVHVGQAGLVLHAFGAEPLRFTSTVEALEFLTAPPAKSA